MEDITVEPFNISQLRGFVSPNILDFFSDTGPSSSMNSDLSDLALILSSDFTRSATLALDDHHPDPPPLEEYVDVLLLACSQQFEDEEELRQQPAKHIK